MKKAIGYIRVSTDKQAHEGVSLDAQKGRIAAWATLNDYALVDVFVDAGISGRKFNNREGLQAALGALKKDMALVVYSMSRLARSTKDAIMISELINKREADLVSLSEKIDTTTAAGKMVFRLMAVMAEFESDIISERVSSALQHKKAKGEKAGNIPYGYRLASDNVMLEPDEDERSVIEWVRAARADGMSLQRIADALNELDAKTRKGTPWRKQYVANLLSKVA